MGINSKAEVGMHTPPLNKCGSCLGDSSVQLPSTFKSVFSQLQGASMSPEKHDVTRDAGA